MAIYFMHSKTFLDDYIQEDPEIVARTQYVIVSSSIKKSTKYSNQVIIGNKYFYPNMALIVDFETYKEPEYERLYREQLSEYTWFFASLIANTIRQGLTVVFLCALGESKYRWFKIMRQYLNDEFHYHIYDYKKVKSGKEFVRDDDLLSVLETCDEIVANSKREQMHRTMSNPNLRSKYLQTLSRKELLKMLQSMGVDGFEDASKEEIMEAIDVYS